MPGYDNIELYAILTRQDEWDYGCTAAFDICRANEKLVRR